MRDHDRQVADALDVARMSRGDRAALAALYDRYAAVLLGLGLSSLLPAFLSQPMLAAVWVVALGLGLRGGLWLPVASSSRWDRDRKRLQLAGSWLPLIVILVIFSLRYTAAVSMALHPAWRQDLVVQVPLTLAFGALSGLFLGRALGLWRLVRA